jgi:hypothetical protein
VGGSASPAYAGFHDVYIRVIPTVPEYYDQFAASAPHRPVCAWEVLTVEVPELICEPDGNDDFPDAEAVNLNSTITGSLCRPGGVDVDSVDYYTFTVTAGNTLQGYIDLACYGGDTTLTMYDSAFTVVDTQTVAGYEAYMYIDPLHLTVGQYYIGVEEHLAADTYRYRLIVFMSEVVMNPPVITSPLSGPQYPRNRWESEYSIGVDSTWEVTYWWSCYDEAGVPFFEDVQGTSDGLFSVTFFDEGILEGHVQMQCTASDGVNPDAVSELYDVWVNGLIFHADLSDNVTGDNVDWTTTGGVGWTTWTAGTVTDSVLEGEGRKFGVADTDYTVDSADILVSPPVSIPATMTQGIVVFRHSYEMDVVFSNLPVGGLWTGYDGGNVKITEAPVIPTYDTPSAEIIAGRPYWANITSPPFSDQPGFSGDSGVLGALGTLTTSVARIPPGLAGSDINVAFAIGSDDIVTTRGWLIDEVAIYVADDSVNTPPHSTFEAPATQMPAFADPLHYHLDPIDDDGDRTFITWSIWDFRDPGTRVYTEFYDPLDNNLDFTIQDLRDDIYSNRFHVEAALTDGFTDPVYFDHWAVGDGVLFEFDPNSPDGIDLTGWETGFIGSSDSTWFGPHATDPLIPGHGYKFGPSGADYTTDDQHVLFTPQIFVPPGFVSAGAIIAHSYQFYDNDGLAEYHDGGNIHILDGVIYMDAFDWTNPPVEIADIVGMQMYDATLNQSGELSGMDAFCDDEGPGLMRYSAFSLDPSWIGNVNGLRIAFAASTSDTTPGRRGWLIDEIIVNALE